MGRRMDPPTGRNHLFSATGIAVRTIAPFVVSKKTDPAVVVIDEQGSYAISLLRSSRRTN